jgi:hypothetical protein
VIDALSLHRASPDVEEGYKLRALPITRISTLKILYLGIHQENYSN